MVLGCVQTSGLDEVKAERLSIVHLTSILEKQVLRNCDREAMLKGGRSVLRLLVSDLTDLQWRQLTHAVEILPGVLHDKMQTSPMVPLL